MVREAPRGVTDRGPVSAPESEAAGSDSTSDSLRRYRWALEQLEDLQRALARASAPPSSSSTASALQPSDETQLSDVVREPEPPAPAPETELSELVREPEPPAVGRESPPPPASKAGSRPSPPPPPRGALVQRRDEALRSVATLPAPARRIPSRGPSRRSIPYRWVAIAVFTVALAAVAVTRPNDPVATDETSVREGVQDAGNSVTQSRQGSRSQSEQEADEPAEPSRGAGDAGDRTPTRTRTHVNEAGGYSFEYPVEWDLDTEAETSKVWSPSGHLVASFALGPQRLRKSYDNFVSLLRSSYAFFRVGESKVTSVSGNKAVAIRGRARQLAGRLITFRALIVERSGERSVGAFAATDVGRFDPRLEEILRSLRT